MEQSDGMQQLNSGYLHEQARYILAKALIVSSAFPPMGTTGGTIRLVKLIKFLSMKGWKFIVFTQDPSRPIAPEQNLSEFLLEELPSDLVIERVPAPFSTDRAGLTIQPSRFEEYLNTLFRQIFGDSALPWGLLVLWKAIRAVPEARVDIVFGTAPPFTNVLIASLIAWVSGKPFVLDLRDDWVGAPVFLGKKVWRQKIESIMEALIVRRASAVVTVTPQSNFLYKERYAYLNKPGKFHLIPNGCDLDEFTRLKTRERRIVSEKFLILSAAWWYRKGHRDLRPFLQGLEEFFKRHGDARGRVDVIMLGNSFSEEHEQALADLHLDGVIRGLGSIGRVELIEWLWKADLFLLVQPAGNTTAVSGTLYEYWATGKAPILLISEKGASSDLVEDNHLGGHFHFDQVEQIADFIERQFDAYIKGSPSWISRDGVDNFDRKALADEMAGIWRSLISGE